MKIELRVLAACVSLLLGTSAAQAQPTLVFAGSSESPIPLDSAQTVSVGADGSLQAGCVFQSGTSTCMGMGSVVGAQVPVTGLSVTGLTQDAQGRFQVNAGQAVTVTRTITNPADVCVATSAAGTTGWADVIRPPASSTSTVQFSSNGDATLSLRCYNVGGAAATPTQLRFVVSGSSSGGCSLPPNPRIRPQGFTEYVRTWPEVFNGRTYPNTPSFATPVGSFTVTLNQSTSPPSAGMYLSIPVTLPADRTLSIFTTQVTGAEGMPGYTVPRQGNVFIGLSPCAGDLRARNMAGADVYERHCRGMMGESTIAFTTRTSNGCSVPPGDYWLTVIHADPSQSNFSQFTNTCSSGTKCESGFSVSLF